MDVIMKMRFIWRALKSRYRDNRIELTALKSYIKPDDIVCDIGDNKGSFILWLSKWAYNGKVVAFEPQITLANYLKKVTQSLCLTNVIVESKGVSSQTGKNKLFVPGGGISPGASLNKSDTELEDCTVSNVDVTSLDDYFPLESHVGVLKIDVEGGELDVFKGAARILKNCRPILVFECENRHLLEGSVFDVFDFLYKFNYAGQYVSRNARVDIQSFDPAIHQKETGHRFWDKKDYINNFIFYPKES